MNLIRHEIFTYRTRDGKAYFKFSYHRVQYGFEIDIHSHPSYRTRSTDMETIHRLASSREAPYKICVYASHRPKTLQEAKNLSIAYAEYTWEYIKTGVTIDEQIANQN